jgi:transposase-like protein
MKSAAFSLQKKQECVAYALGHPEMTSKQLASDLGIGASTLDKWIKLAMQNGTAPGGRKLTPEQERIRQLEKEVAHVYFVNHPRR